MAKQSSARNPVENLLLPPPHVSQRCGAKARSTAQPCKRYASIGHRRCKFHGGATGSGRPQVHGRRSAQTQRNQVVVGALMSMVRNRYKKPDEIEVPYATETLGVIGDNLNDLSVMAVVSLRCATQPDAVPVMEEPAPQPPEQSERNGAGAVADRAAVALGLPID